MVFLPIGGLSRHFGYMLFEDDGVLIGNLPSFGDIAIVARPTHGDIVDDFRRQGMVHKAIHAVVFHHHGAKIGAALGSQGDVLGTTTAHPVYNGTFDDAVFDLDRGEIGIAV